MTQKNPWFVLLEVRPKGAIGKFSAVGMSSIADTLDDAIADAIKHWHAKGYETRFALKVYQYTENTPI